MKFLISHRLRIFSQLAEANDRRFPGILVLLFVFESIFSISVLSQAQSPSEPSLRMTYYRGPGTTDRDLGPKVCDGDPETEWVATGLTRTTLGPPFEFVFEAIDGRQLNLAGVRILAASAAEGRRLADFEIKTESVAGSGVFDKVVYRGRQEPDAREQSHLFEAPVTVGRFQWFLKSNHGDRNEFRVNEIRPILDAAETATTAALPIASTIPKVAIRPVDPESSAKYLYQPLKVEPVPLIKGDNGKPLAPIDAWLMRSLAAKGLRFSPQADPEVLIRRLALNLTGLPPDPKDSDRFREDPSEENYRAIVEKYLGSKAYGENQARSWLDVVRYADSDGYAADGIRADAWRFRDYVISAFNADKPYDRFLTEQLAADELANTPPESLPALSMARLGPFRTNSGNQNLERNRQELITEMVSNVSLTFLGLTIGCARCHDHKIDPIPQADYYRFAAYFAATEPASLPLSGPARQMAQKSASDEIRKQMEPYEARIQSLRDQAAQRLREIRKRALDARTLAALDKPHEQRTAAEVALVKVVELELEPKEAEITAELKAEEKSEIAAAEAKLKDLRSRRPGPLPSAWGLKDSGRNAPATYLLHRGEIERKTGVVDPRAPSAFSAAELSTVPKVDPKAKSSGRRLALANWMTGPGQAQVARVFVNRIWQQHFGRGIVGTPNNFGDLGDDPTHPELLEWLADDFIRNGWSVKRLHCQIVLSQAFRQTSSVDESVAAIDPLNELFSRQNRRRLTAEELRDGLLALAGNLNIDHRGGPGIAPELPPEVLQRLKTAWRPTADKNATRARSVYLLVDRNLVLPILEEFDQPDTMTSCARRNQSTHALQSLAMLNHPWIIDRARDLGRLSSTHGTTVDARLAWLYRHVTGRPVTESIRNELREAWNRSAAAIRETDEPVDPDEVWTDVALVIVNSVEWLYVE